jgi:hypothetical protein
MFLPPERRGQQQGGQPSLNKLFKPLCPRQIPVVKGMVPPLQNKLTMKKFFSVSFVLFINKQVTQ